MTVLCILTGVILGIILCLGILKYLEQKKIIKNKNESEIILKNANLQRDEILKNAKTESGEILGRAQKLEERLLEKEKKLESKLEDIGKKQEFFLQKEDDLKVIQERLIKKELELSTKLGEIARLSEEEAREILLKQIAQKYEKDSLIQIERYKKSLEERKNEIAKEIIIKSIQQYAGDVTSDVTTTLIPLQNDDLKGKLIGKEGRNIIAFERVAGVSLIIDDTPDTVFISSFDLFKRYIAKKSLEKLLEDGRIQPARIEEIVEIVTKEADMLLKDIGEKTIDELGITGIPKEIVPLIGKLRFRTSYGQNILKHSIEVAFIAESIALDLGLDSKLIKIGGLLHDLGKALDHDVGGTHPEIGAKIARKYGIDDKIIDMITNHHGEHLSISIYASVIQVADAISSVRPGARKESIEQYIKRIKEMEALVASFSGVSKAYAVSAGREIRVFVDADIVSDYEAHEMARNIALDIESKLNYSGEIKINLIREMRVIEYAR